MISSNSIDDLTNNDFKYGERNTNHCQECAEEYCMDHSINQTYQISLNSDEIEMILPDQLKTISHQDKQVDKKSAIIMTTQFQSNENNHLQNEIEQLKKEIIELKLKLDEFSHQNQEKISEEQSHTNNQTVSPNNRLLTTNSLPLNNELPKKKRPVVFIFSTLRNSVTNKTWHTRTLSQPIFKQTTPSILDLKQNRTFSLEQEPEPYSDSEDDEEMIVYLDDRTTSTISHKVHLSNNIVRYLRGPIKSMVHGTMHAVDIIAQGTRISDAALQAVKKGLDRQKQRITDEQNNKNSVLPTFVEITSDWILEGENPYRGFSSPSIWMRDPQGRRILVKIQEHPLCAANEWLAYVLGKFLGLPVNEVQIAVQDDNLVTLHTDVASEDEKTVTFMDLQKRRRKALMTDPIIERMDIFDQIIQNVDRNQQNILITMPKTTDINDNIATVKVYFIDHSNCFGMGKLNGISLIASKFHSNHLAVVKFDPIQKSKQFEQYFIKLPVEDRPLISKTLNRFAMITDEQFDSWMSEIQDLLSPSQYNRIHGVLYRQRDIAKRYTIQWGISPRPSSIKSDEIRQEQLEMDDTVIRL